ncbi:MAG TPA: CAP domain-containing protein [Chloroflexota bacterium]|nr:CAP domain-containing protein [Chloroflexota bacterium]
MPRLVFVWLVLMCLAIALPAGDVAAGTDAERARVVELVNQERVRSGLAPVWENTVLTSAGEAYAAYMASADFFSHTGPDGSTVSSRAEAAGYAGWTWLGENIAAGQSTPEQVFQAWMNSAGHRANILSPNAREIGIGHAEDAGARYRHYWTMELGDRVGAAPPAPTRTGPVPPTPTPARYLGPAGPFRLHVPAAPKAPTGF